MRNWWRLCCFSNGEIGALTWESILKWPAFWRYVHRMCLALSSMQQLDHDSTRTAGMAPTQDKVRWEPLLCLSWQGFRPHKHLWRWDSFGHISIIAFIQLLNETMLVLRGFGCCTSGSHCSELEKLQSHNGMFKVTGGETVRTFAHSERGRARWFWSDFDCKTMAWQYAHHLQPCFEAKSIFDTTYFFHNLFHGFIIVLLAACCVVPHPFPVSVGFWYFSFAAKQLETWCDLTNACAKLLNFCENKVLQNARLTTQLYT